VFFEDLVRALDGGHVRYALVGGVAVNLHGIPRMTYDVDIVVRTDAVTLRACKEALSSLGLSCRLPIALETLEDAGERARLETERNLIAVTFTDPANPLREVDVLVAPSIDPDGIVERSVARSAGAFEVRIASIDDLVRMTSETDLVYYVTDEMLERFAASTTLQRLQWLDEMRTFTWNAATAATRLRWRAERGRSDP